jgi:hypothetical protein
MYPKSALCDQVECLETLLGLRSKCTGGTNCYPFYVEDIQGVDIKTLSKIAKGSNLSGADFAQQLINSSARQMVGDIELLINGGYNMPNIVGEVCSMCQHLPTYTADAGIVVKSLVQSRFQELRLTKLQILANVTGVRQLEIIDGIETKFTNVNLTAGVIIPVNLEYKTSARSVQIKFTDPTVPLGQIYCATNTSCGCGGVQNPNASRVIQITGLQAGNEVSTQYGFLPCASVTCSFDSLVCAMIKNTPKVFGLTLLYKFGEQYFLHRNASDRNNEAVSMNEADEGEVTKDYGKLYWSRLQGGSMKLGVKTVISDFLKHNKDKCVVCDSKTVQGHVTG